ncbi:C4-dicarboxylate TRAP transporter substrate-binding protein [Arthrobacter sp. P2b]|uniref:C4-dicarboxylate TRAP transporter substrate-binding protein n=1 Tax=Arthrobacter sp. P2b TaxID=1938741 RepID=UPI0009C61212|nr:C4-dicarboxylate TRAP transporter substrate-binding protein [Arthrobacter sp. P2b]SLK16476.1 TRAP-type C4-dicarboxylate transport system, substrate-binding protein [Arthrobacter sp. P2b]
MTSIQSSARMVGVAAIAVSTSLFLGACTGGSGAAERNESGTSTTWLEDLEPIELTVSHNPPEKTPSAQAALAFQRAVTERTDGKVTFENFFASSLLTAGADGIDGIGTGTADMGDIVPFYSPAELPVSTWASNLGAVRYDTLAESQVVGSAASFFDYMESEPIAEEFASHNLKVLATNATTPYELICTKPIDSLDDAKGTRVRAAGPIWTVGLEALGMIPTTVAFGEVYEALQRGVIDCTLIPAFGFIDYNYLDVAKHHIPANFPHTQAMAWAINLDVWNSFPVELQRIIQEEAVHMPYDVSVGHLEKTAEFGEASEKSGIVHHDPAELNKVLDKRYSDVLKDMVSTAPAQIDDPQSYIDTYVARVDDWRTRTKELGNLPEQGQTIQDYYLSLKDPDLDWYLNELRESVRSKIP